MQYVLFVSSTVIMKIIDKINQFEAETPYFSFEYFPPKTDAGVENLYDRYPTTGDF